MRAWKFKAWRSASMAAVALAACGPADEPTPAAPAAPATPAAGEAEEAAPAARSSESGESGEAGAASAYAGLAGDDLTALRLTHLKGFLMIAQRVAETGASDDAAVLVAQGVLEVYEPAPDQFGGLDIATVRAASEAAGQPRAEVERRITTALAAIDAARAPLATHAAVLTARMTDIASGLYQGVVQNDFVDPIEYQHSQGAALAARDELNAGRAALNTANRRAYNEARTELDRFVTLWPSVTPPQTPASYGQVLAQASRVRLALSPYL